MGVFGNFKTDVLEEQARDVVGYQAFESDIYRADIKLAYMSKAKSGALSIVFEFNLDGKPYRETVYFTDKTGKHYYMTKPKDGSQPKKAPLPGFTLINDICVIATDKELEHQNTEDKVVKVYDFDSRKEVPTAVPVLVDLLDKKVALAILQVLENKSEQQGGEWVPTMEERTTNRIEKALHPELKVTINEARETKPPEFWDKWLSRNKGKQRDEREHKEDSKDGAGKGGKEPGGQRKSLFG